MDLIWPSELKFDLEPMRQGTHQLMSRYGLRSCQLGLTHSLKAKTAEEKVYDCLGPLWDAEQQIFRRHEHEYTIFNDEFKNNYLYKVYKRVQEWSPLKLGRFRILSRSPGQCYPMHFDFDIKYHITIETNPSSYFLFENKQTYHLPADGALYCIDSRPSHTSLNAGDSERIHLAFNTFE